MMNNDSTSPQIDIEKELAQVQKMAKLLDSQFKLPWGLTVGLDSLVGLIPGVGDLATGSMSAWIIIKARQLGVGKFTLFRMILNSVIDTVIGAIPVVGDLFDLVFKANLRNLKLLERHLKKQQSRAPYRELHAARYS